MNTNSCIIIKSSISDAEGRLAQQENIKILALAIELSGLTLIENEGTVTVVSEGITNVNVKVYDKSGNVSNTATYKIRIWFVNPFLYSFYSVIKANLYSTGVI